ncbi:MAG: hypothetical protein AMJ92_02030 [candidate division Zixibacteria bacterium SM23_81]|nr:MAG: hypothetical protein AMJ92_02030 [candidate division Zixibacteria bacterium SM23_81]
MKGHFQIHRLSQWNLGALGLILVILSFPSWAQKDEISIQASVDPDTVHIGDVITYTLTVIHAPEVTFQATPPGTNLGAFEVRDYQVMPQEELQDGQLQSEIRLLLTTFQTGELDIPAVEIVAVDSSGHIDTLSTSRMPIAVASLNPDQNGDIKDIKPPVKLPGARPFLSWLIGGLILLAVGTALLLYLRKRRLRQALSTIEYQGPPRPAHEIALEELDRIASLNLIQRGLIKQFYTEISEAIKRYIGRRYRLQTMELTTAELVSAMEQASLSEEDVGIFKPFFQECDLVKFAKHIPLPDRIDGALEDARQLVLSTREEPVVTPSEAVLAKPLSDRE